MINAGTLDTLVDLARQAVEKAGLHLRRLTDERLGAEQQLAMLHSYRQDYMLRLQNTIENGVSASNYQNFRRFIETLDAAILQQNKALAHMEGRIRDSQRHWNERQRQLNAYEALATRRQCLVRERQARAEQRLYDEAAANAYRRHLHPLS